VIILAWVALCLVIASGLALRWIVPVGSGAPIQSFEQVLPMMALLSVPAALGLFVVVRLVRDVLSKSFNNNAILVAILVTGLVLRVLWFGAVGPLEDDFQRYLWDGALTANGFDPYRWSPRDVVAGAGVPAGIVALRELAPGVLSAINHPDLTTIYPGFAQVMFAVAYVIAPFSIDGLRVVFLVAELATCALLIAWLDRLGRSRLLVAIYWCNPLVAFTMVGQAHMDALLPPLMLGAVLAMELGRARVGVGLLGLAVGVKVWPLLVFPLLVRRWFDQPAKLFGLAMVFACVIGVVMLPLALASVQAYSGLASYAQGAHNNNGVYAWASYGLYLAFGENEGAQRGLRAAVGLLAASLIAWISLPRVASLDDTVGRVLACSAIVFYCAPAQFPWYAVWFLPWAVLVPSFPLAFAAVTLPAYFAFFPLWNTGRGGDFLYAVAFVHAVPVWAWLAWDASRLRASVQTLVFARGRV
jgi:alpha-1,6-mannosyltransferase